MYVPLPARRTEAPFYAYPSHLKAEIEGLPHAPGVYLFHAGGQPAPLYIGKSVDIRSRVLAHLRTPREARLLRQADHIRYLRTAGDLGAQLLESSLIKRLQPLYNKKLRAMRQAHSLQLHRGRVSVVAVAGLGFAAPGNLHGLFASRAAAMQRLAGIADDNRLCHGLLGLERRARGRACFRVAIDRCAGACCGLESEGAHALRLAAALEELRLQAWPCPGRIALVERGAGLTQYHVLRDWQYLGSVERLEEAHALPDVIAAFDADAYRLLRGPVHDGRHEVVPLGGSG